MTGGYVRIPVSNVHWDVWCRKGDEEEQVACFGTKCRAMTCMQEMIASDHLGGVYHIEKRVGFLERGTRKCS